MLKACVNVRPTTKNQQLWEEGPFISPILQMGKLRPEQSKELPESHNYTERELGCPAFHWYLLLIGSSFVLTEGKFQEDGVLDYLPQGQRPWLVDVFRT